MRISGEFLPSCPKSFKELKAEGVMPGSCELRQSAYLNNLVDAATIARVKRLVKLGMGFFSFETAWRTRGGDMRTMNLLRKGQICGIGKGDSMRQMTFSAIQFGVAV